MPLYFQVTLSSDLKISQFEDLKMNEVISVYASLYHLDLKNGEKGYSEILEGIMPIEE